MSLRFKCAFCSSEIIVEWLQVGERAECNACNQKSLVPLYSTISDSSVFFVQE
jgi:DNA-directed RNA polymerase subunit RPC12/RpoP